MIFRQVWIWTLLAALLILSDFTAVSFAQSEVLGNYLTYSNPNLDPVEDFDQLIANQGLNFARSVVPDATAQFIANRQVYVDLKIQAEVAVEKLKDQKVSIDLILQKHAAGGQMDAEAYASQEAIFQRLNTSNYRIVAVEGAYSPIVTVRSMLQDFKKDVLKSTGHVVTDEEAKEMLPEFCRMFAFMQYLHKNFSAHVVGAEDEPLVRLQYPLVGAADSGNAFALFINKALMRMRDKIVVIKALVALSNCEGGTRAAIVIGKMHRDSLVQIMKSLPNVEVQVIDLSMYK